MGSSRAVSLSLSPDKPHKQNLFVLGNFCVCVWEVLLRNEPKTPCMEGKHPISELCFQPYLAFSPVWPRTPYVDQAGIELQISACLVLPNAGIKGLFHHTHCLFVCC